MLPLPAWFAAVTDTTGASELRLTPQPAARGPSLRRLLGHALIRLGRALSGPARAPRSVLVDGLAPR